MTEKVNAVKITDEERKMVRGRSKKMWIVVLKSDKKNSKLCEDYAND